MKQHQPTGYWTGCACQTCKDLQDAADHRRFISVSNILAKMGLLEKKVYKARS